jgi:hypothetical protein
MQTMPPKGGLKRRRSSDFFGKKVAEGEAKVAEKKAKVEEEAKQRRDDPAFQVCAKVCHRDKQACNRDKKNCTPCPGKNGCRHPRRVGGTLINKKGDIFTIKPDPTYVYSAHKQEEKVEQYRQELAEAVAREQKDVSGLIRLAQSIACFRRNGRRSTVWVQSKLFLMT